MPKLIFQFFNVKPTAENEFSGLSMNVKVIPDPFEVRREYAPDPTRQLTALQKLLTAPIRTEANSHE